MIPRKILNGRTYPMTQPISYLRLSSPGNPKYAPIIPEVAALVDRGPIPIHVSVDSNKISIPHSGFLLTTPPAQPVNVGYGPFWISRGSHALSHSPFSPVLAL